MSRGLLQKVFSFIAIILQNNFNSKSLHKSQLRTPRWSHPFIVEKIPSHDLYFTQCHICKKVRPINCEILNTSGDIFRLKNGSSCFFFLWKKEEKRKKASCFCLKFFLLRSCHSYEINYSVISFWQRSDFNPFLILPRSKLFSASNVFSSFLFHFSSEPPTDLFFNLQFFQSTGFWFYGLRELGVVGELLLLEIGQRVEEVEWH